MDVDAVIRRAPELALVDELAHTNAQGSRNESATRTSTRSSTPASTSSRPSTSSTSRASTTPSSSSPACGSARPFPTAMLDEADEVSLVDISPEALQDRLRAGKVYPGGQAERALLNFFRQDNLSALRELALREVAEDVEARRGPAVLDPLSKQAVGERVLALVEPQPRSQRVLRRAWRSAQRLGGEIDALWMRRPGQQLTPRRRRSSPRSAGSPRSSASTSSRRRETTSSTSCGAWPPSAVPPTSSSALPTSAAGSRSRVARCFRGWSASFPASTSASSPTARCGTSCAR